eukprot:8308102-Heterocapsa_arctica.AAC.1
MDALTPEEMKIYAKQIYQTKLKELNNRNNLGYFKPSSPVGAHNIVDARWVICWKGVNADGTKGIKARLTVRGFQDLQGFSLETYAGTASRWGQRMIVSIAAVHGRQLFSADVGSAFLKGLTFDEVATMTGQPVRA